MKRPASAPLPSQQTAGLALFESVRGPILAAPATRNEALQTRQAEHEENRARILAAFREHGPMTADEAGARCGLHFIQARPRVSQLASPAFGSKLRDTGRIGRSALGNPAAIYEVAP